jgi:hypothetical protein
MMLDKMMLGRMTLGRMTLGRMTLSKTTQLNGTLSLTLNNPTLFLTLV